MKFSEKETWSDDEQMKLEKYLDVLKTRKLLRENYSWKKEYFSQYCSYTTIHGFKYLGELQRALIEKIWWVVIMSLSICWCLCLIHVNYTKWAKSPIITNPSSDKSPIWQLPFPAVTICNAMPIRRSVYDYSKAKQKYKREEAMSLEELYKFFLAKAFCSWLYLPDSEMAMDFLDQIGNGVDDMFDVCIYGVNNSEETKETCSTLFVPLITGYAMKCFTFNMFDRQDFFADDWMHYNNNMHHGKRNMGWTVEKGYPAHAEIDTYPRRVTLKHLSFTLKSNKSDIDPGCGNTNGYGIAFHHPAEYPKLAIGSMVLKMNKRIVIEVTPSFTETMDDLRSYTPKERNCYFETEKRLIGHKVYSKHACLRECWANYTKLLCDCVSFELRSLHKNTPTCSFEHIKCVVVVSKTFWSYEGDLASVTMDRIFFEIFDAHIKDLKYQTISKDHLFDCECYPTCTELSYKVDKLEFDAADAEEDNERIDDYEYTDVGVTIKNFVFIGNKRHKLVESIAFFSNCGGLLGVFSGISFISLFEIIYFLTLRLWFNKRNQMQAWGFHP